MVAPPKGARRPKSAAKKRKSPAAASSAKKNKPVASMNLATMLSKMKSSTPQALMTPSKSSSCSSSAISSPNGVVRNSVRSSKLMGLRSDLYGDLMMHVVEAHPKKTGVSNFLKTHSSFKFKRAKVAEKLKDLTIGNSMLDFDPNAVEEFLSKEQIETLEKKKRAANKKRARDESEDVAAAAPKAKKKKKDPNAPKKPKSAWVYFLEERRASNPDLSYKDAMTQAKDPWNEISKADKAKFVELNRLDKERYAEELAVYEKKKSLNESVETMGDEDVADKGVKVDVKVDEDVPVPEAAPKAQPSTPKKPAVKQPAKTVDPKTPGKSHDPKLKAEMVQRLDFYFEKTEIEFDKKFKGGPEFGEAEWELCVEPELVSQAYSLFSDRNTEATKSAPLSASNLGLVVLRCQGMRASLKEVCLQLFKDKFSSQQQSVAPEDLELFLGGVLKEENYGTNKRPLKVLEIKRTQRKSILPAVFEAFTEDKGELCKETEKTNRKKLSLLKKVLKTTESVLTQLNASKFSNEKLLNTRQKHRAAAAKLEEKFSEFTSVDAQLAQRSRSPTQAARLAQTSYKDRASAYDADNPSTTLSTSPLRVDTGSPYTFESFVESCRRPNRVVPLDLSVDSLSAYTPGEAFENDSDKLEVRLSLLRERPLKLLQFSENCRPSYFGTFTKRGRCSAIDQFKKGVNDDFYEYDSDMDWEDVEDAESISSKNKDLEAEDALDYDDGFLMNDNEVLRGDGADERTETQANAGLGYKSRKATLWLLANCGENENDDDEAKNFLEGVDPSDYSVVLKDSSTKVDASEPQSVVLKISAPRASGALRQKSSAIKELTDAQMKIFLTIIEGSAHSLTNLKEVVSHKLSELKDAAAPTKHAVGKMLKEFGSKKLMGAEEKPRYWVHDDLLIKHGVKRAEFADFECTVFVKEGLLQDFAKDIGKPRSEVTSEEEKYILDKWKDQEKRKRDAIAMMEAAKRNRDRKQKKEQLLQEAEELLDEE